MYRICTLKDFKIKDRENTVAVKCRTIKMTDHDGPVFDSSRILVALEKR